MCNSGNKFFKGPPSNFIKKKKKKNPQMQRKLIAFQNFKRAIWVTSPNYVLTRRKFIILIINSYCIKIDRVRGSNLQYYLPKYQLHININFMCIYIIYYILYISIWFFVALRFLISFESPKFSVSSFYYVCIFFNFGFGINLMTST